MRYQVIQDFLSISDNSPIIDVRSPAEYEQGHIPCAHNIPLFSNVERAEIGKTYKQDGKEIAVKEGLKIVSPKMNNLLEQVEKINTGKSLRIYCWRGGMRSSSVAWLFETVGYKCSLLKSGYKSYRGLMDNIFEKQEIILIGGETGSGKTEVLHELKNKGEQTIDLEGLANHKGSAFGSVGMPPQPTNEQFQNLVIEAFLRLDTGRKVFIEDESAHIGRVSLPDNLWLKMKKNPLLYLSVPLKGRIDRLVSDYGDNDIEELGSCIRKIERKLGGQNVKAAMEYLKDGNLADVAKLMLGYYDKSYRLLLDKKKDNIICTIQGGESDPMVIAEDIIKKMQEVEIHGAN